jgi:iron complex outermembrane receptor protein
VLKDGASAIYGSDAIAGVVNIILKKQFQGFEVSGDFGSSYKADGLSQRMSATYGFGDLAADGHNVYFNVEYRHQASIAQESRGSYLNQLDLRPYGGNDLRGGIITSGPPNNSAYTVPGQVAPLGGGQQLDQFYLLPGCSSQNLNYSGGCTWDPNLYKKIQPRSEGLNLTAHWTQSLGDAWTNTVSTSLFDSKTEQYRQPNQFLEGTALVPFVWAGSRGVLVDQTDPATTQIVLPANHPDNPFNPASAYFAGAQAYYGAAFANYVGLPALFYAALTDIPPQHTLYRTDVVRIVDDVNGTVGGWDLSGSIGYVRDATHITYQGFVRASALAAALADGTYRVGQNAYLNSPSLYATLAPQTSDTATSDLAYISATGSRELWSLPGGSLGLATGVEARVQKSNNPGQPYAPEGDILMDGSFYASGSQTIFAAFGELSAPVLRTLELNAAARVDHYNLTGTAFTPKFGFKWKMLPQLALRGTFARGFRAPGPAENGNAGTATSLPAIQDPIRCPITGTPIDCGLGGNVALLVPSNPDLKPERSRSITVGFVVDPLPRVSLTVDYFNIRRNDEITGAPLDPSNAIRGAQQPGTDYPGPITAYLTPYVNASYSLVTGIDTELRAGMDLAGHGILSAKLDATYLMQSQQTFGDQTYHYVGTVGPNSLGGAVGTPRARGTFTLDYTNQRFSVGSTYNYHSAEKGLDESGSNTCIQLNDPNPRCYVASFGYVDLYGQYQLTGQLQLTATVTNVTNRLAPLNTATYGGTNYNPSLDQAGAIGRFFELSFNFHL